MSRPFPLLALLTFAFVALFALSPLASDGFNGFTPTQFPVVQDFWPVQPAGYAFSIWGVIYLWLTLGAGFGLWKRARDPEWQAMRKPLILSLGIGIFWIAAANAVPVMATVMIWAMAVFAIAAWMRAGPNDAMWQLRPVGLYAGWLTAATGVATGVVMGGYGLLSAQAAAILSLVGVLAVALWVQGRRDDWAYPVAVVWALLGVIVANIPSANWPVIGLATLGIAALTGAGLMWKKEVFA